MSVLSRCWLGPLSALVMLMGCQSTPGGEGAVSAPSAASLQGRWQLQALQGAGVADGSRAFIEFSEPPRLTGNGGCNRFFGVYRYQEQALMIESALGSTKMACNAEVMVQEQRLFQLLPQAVTVDEVADNELVLHASDGDELIRIKRIQ